MFTCTLSAGGCSVVDSGLEGVNDFLTFCTDGGLSSSLPPQRPPRGLWHNPRCHGVGPIGAWAVSMELPGKGLELDLEGMMMGDVWGLWLVVSPVKKYKLVTISHGHLMSTMRCYKNYCELTLTHGVCLNTRKVSQKNKEKWLKVKCLCESEERESEPLSSFRLHLD